MKLFVILVILATKAFSLPHGIVDETLGGEPERYAAFAESPSESLSLASQEMNDDVIATSENDAAYVYARPLATQELEGMEMMGEDDMPEMESEDDMATMRSENDMLEIESTTPGLELQSDEEMINESPMADSEHFYEQEAEEMQSAIMLDEVEVLDDGRAGMTLQSDDLDNEKPSQETDDDESSDDQEMVSSPLAAAYISDGINNYYVN